MKMYEACKILTRNGYSLTEAGTHKGKEKVEEFPLHDLKIGLNKFMRNQQNTAAAVAEAEECRKQLEKYTISNWHRFKKMEDQLTSIKLDPQYQEFYKIFHRSPAKALEILKITGTKFVKYTQMTTDLQRSYGTIVQCEKSVVSNDHAKQLAKKAIDLCSDKKFLEQHKELQQLAETVMESFNKWKNILIEQKYIVEELEDKYCSKGYIGYAEDPDEIEANESFRKLVRNQRMNEGIMDSISNFLKSIKSKIKKILGMEEEVIDTFKDVNDSIDDSVDICEELNSLLTPLLDVISPEEYEYVEEY